MGRLVGATRAVACGAPLVLLATVACGRTGGTSGGAPSTAAPSSTESATAAPVTSTAAAASVGGALLVNDGTDPRRPILSPEDASFTDRRHGWGWSDRCLNESHAGKYGWAMAACQKGLDLPDLDGQAKPALIYNEGVVAEAVGDKAGARVFYGRALALRPPDDPYHETVMQAVSRVGGNPCNPDEEASVCFGMTSLLCCYKKCKKDSECPTGFVCGDTMCIPSP